MNLKSRIQSHIQLWRQPENHHEIMWWLKRRSLLVKDDAEYISLLVGKKISAAEVQQYLDEIADIPGFRARWTEHRTVGQERPMFDEMLNSFIATTIMLVAYVSTRIRQPKIVVETGCAAGLTSTLFLGAMAKNQKGHLYTVDLPTTGRETDMDWGLPKGYQPGFMVPDILKDRWTLILGDARDSLPDLLNNLEQIDYFMHDSNHTYPHMMWEYITALPYVKAGGLFISDDITAHTAFWDYARAVGYEDQMRFHAANPNIGTWVK